MYFHTINETQIHETCFSNLAAYDDDWSRNCGRYHSTKTTKTLTAETDATE